MLMRLDGELMVIRLKDAAKLVGICIISFCAVFVCTMFLSYNIDITSIQDKITMAQVQIFYDAQVLTSKVVSGVSGGCLLITSIIMLLFYIKHYIDTHKKELGILKALGYSNLKIAKNFWIFGLSVLIGTMLGFLAAYCFMPTFYDTQNADNILPEIEVHFHLSLFFFLVILPTIVFSIISIIYACVKLKKPTLNLLKDILTVPSKQLKYKNAANSDLPFLNELQKNTLRQKKTLVFFIIFASFCFSAMTQMSFSMNELASELMGMMIMMIGIVLACTTLFLAITTVIRGNIKTIVMMKIFGYSKKECSKAILGGYRPMAYIGFVLGTIYQYMLLKIMVTFAFRDIENVPDYKFDFPMMCVSLIFFIVLYELVLYCYSNKIKNISIKEIMLEN